MDTILKEKETGDFQIAIQEAGVYSAEDIQRALGIGRSKTYSFLQEVYRTQKPFRVIKIGKLFRVPKYSFDRWLYTDGEVV